MQQPSTRGAAARRGLLILGAGALGALAIGAGWQAAGPAAALGESAAPGPEAWPGALPADPVPAWSLVAWQAIAAEGGHQDPLAASRLLAMLHLAMHDAVNAAAPRFAVHALERRDPGADPAMAAAAAAHGVLLAAFPAQRDALGREFAKTGMEAGRGAASTRGEALGAAAAEAILAARAQDGAARRMRYGTLTHLGAYRFTPGVEALLAPHWGRVRPFALAAPDQFRAPPPPPVESAAYARDLEEVRRIGGRLAAERSPAQTRIAHFWQECPTIGWNRIARLAARAHGLDMWEGARLFALLNMALADAAIAAWDSKLHHDSWRPVTAIRLADVDFNAGTTGDPGWEPLLPTPPMQGHPSAQAALGAAAAAVLAGLFGDGMRFALASGTALAEEPVRRFPGFRAAAQEAAESRILAGLQFRFAAMAGLELGGQVGRRVLASQLRPLGGS